MIRTLFFIVLLIRPVFQENTVPPLNQSILQYVESVIGIQVDRGECWDLAYQALNRNNAQWDGQFKYGRLLNPKKEEIYPGDIIQFKNVKIRYAKGQMIFTEVMDQHTAIVYKVLKKGHFEIAHQNNQFSGRKVGVSEFNLNHVVQGKVFIYRPVEG